jgi:hypothetical protein
MIMPFAAMIAIHGRFLASHAETRSRRSIAIPTSHNVSATMQTVGGFMFEIRSASVPTMLRG